MARYLVLGGGIAGLSAALRLGMAGEDVILVDRMDRGGGATSRSAGVITVQLESEEEIRIAAKSIEILEELLGDGGRESTGLVSRGFLSIEDEEDSEETRELLRRAGVRFEQLSHVEASRRWPSLRFQEGEVITHTWIDMGVEPGTLLEFLRERAVEVGVDVRRYEVLYLGLEKNHVEFVKTSGGELRADVIFLCMGPWNQRILSKAGVRIPVWVIKCPAHRFRVSVDAPAFADEVHQSYWRPGFDRTLVGGGYHAEPCGNPDECLGKPNPEFGKDAERLLRLRVKGEVELVDEWAGPCSIPPDFEPIVGRLEGFENLYIIDGLRGYGLMKGVALAQSLAEEVMGLNPSINLEPYSPSRFAALDLKA